MKTLYLHGKMAEVYGASFSLDAANPPEMVRALCVQLPGFQESIEAGEWHVIRGPLDQQDADDEDRLTMSLAEQSEVHLVPAIKGAGGGGGVISAIIGAVLIVVGVVYPNPALVAAGAGMLLGGIIQMTTKIPGADTNTESSDNRASFLFSGPKNQSTQGVTIPRGYGRCRVGSIVISVGLYAEDMDSQQGTQGLLV